LNLKNDLLISCGQSGVSLAGLNYSLLLIFSTGRLYYLVTSRFLYVTGISSASANKKAAALVQQLSERQFVFL
jgi:hypothetical protein